MIDSREKALLNNLCVFLRAKLLDLPAYMRQSSPGFFNALKIKMQRSTIISQVAALETATARDQVEHVKQAVINLFRAVRGFDCPAFQLELQPIMQDALARTESIITQPSDFDKVNDIISPDEIEALFILRAKLNGTLATVERVLEYSEYTVTALARVLQENQGEIAIKERESALFSQALQEFTRLEERLRKLTYEASSATYVVRRWEEKEVCECWDLGYKCHGHRMITREETAPDMARREAARAECIVIDQQVSSLRAEPAMIELHQGIRENQDAITSFIHQNKEIEESIRFITSLKTCCVGLMANDPIKKLSYKIRANYPALVKLFTLLSRNKIKNILILQFLTAIESDAKNCLTLRDAMEDKDLLALALLKAVAPTNDERASNYYYYLLVLLSVNIDNPSRILFNKQQIAIDALGCKRSIPVDGHLLIKIERMYEKFSESVHDRQLQNKLIEALQAAQACDAAASFDDRLLCFWQTLEVAPCHASQP